MRTLLLLAMLVPCLGGAQTRNDFMWLLGRWEISGEPVVQTETWTVGSDSLLRGRGLSVRGRDTLFHEEIVLEIGDGEVFYVVKAYGQNQNEAVKFRMMEAGPERYVFENPQHDFPSRIVYVRKDADHLEAYIEGMQEGQSQRVDFPMKRMR